ELSDAHGVQLEIIDPRTLVPLDEETIVTSVRKTGRLVVADESHASCGVGAELITRVVERCYSDLRSAPRRVSTPDVPIPYSPALEEAVLPSAAWIAEACLATLVPMPRP
ncbi:MAG: acetoin:2,6-dichlorophenolindophenol oxidoreductase subunit beta, partial [Actinomycetota bacterium]|nr:acetoin:2,6-dichlorophenolindophenol oxidoreductase subunit beta [Actinomycetota bacterium]